MDEFSGTPGEIVHIGHQSDEHVCVMTYDLLRYWSRCPQCGRVATDEQLSRGRVTASATPELEPAR